METQVVPLLDTEDFWKSTVHTKNFNSFISRITYSCISKFYVYKDIFTHDWNHLPTVFLKILSKSFNIEFYFKRKNYHKSQDAVRQPDRFITSMFHSLLKEFQGNIPELYQVSPKSHQVTNVLPNYLKSEMYPEVNQCIERNQISSYTAKLNCLCI